MMDISPSTIVMISDALRLEPKHRVVIQNDGDCEIVLTISTPVIGGMRLSENERIRHHTIEPHGNMTVWLYPSTDITIAHPRK